MLLLPCCRVVGEPGLRWFRKGRNVRILQRQNCANSLSGLGSHNPTLRNLQGYAYFHDARSYLTMRNQRLRLRSPLITLSFRPRKKFCS